MRRRVTRLFHNPEASPNTLEGRQGVIGVSEYCYKSNYSPDPSHTWCATSTRIICIDCASMTGTTDRHCARCLSSGAISTVNQEFYWCGRSESTDTNAKRIGVGSGERVLWRVPDVFCSVNACVKGGAVAAISHQAAPQLKRCKNKYMTKHANHC